MEKKIRTKIITLVVIAYFLNLLWEVLHSTLYDWNKAPLINDIFIYCLRITIFASGFDALWVLSFILVNSIIQRNFTWLEEPQKRDHITFAIIGLIVAIFIELHAIVFNMWQYTALMPVIFGIGLTPLVQLAITSNIALYLTSRIEWKEKK